MTPHRARLTLAPGQVLRHDVQIEQGGTVRGRVTDALTGLPIADAEVGEGWTFRKVVRTDAGGDYRIRGFPCPGVYDLHARAGGYGRQARGVGRPAPGEKVVHFELVPAGSARGRILDGGGKPMGEVYAAAVASAFEAADQGMHPVQKTDWQSTRTKPDGTFLIENLRTDVRHALFVRHEGFGTTAYEFPSRAKPRAVVELGDVILLPAGAIEGRIVDLAGTGVASAHLELTGVHADRFRLLTAPDAAAAADGRRSVAGEGYVDRRKAISDPDGRFWFADLADGEYGLRGWVRGGPEVAKPGIRVRAGQLAGDVQLVIDLGLSVRGRVVTPSGESPGETIVTLEQEQPPGGRWRSNWTGAEGIFEFRGVEPGAYVLEARPIPKGEPEWSSGRVGGIMAGSTGVAIPLKRIAWVEGTVLDPTGGLAAGVVVVAFRQEQDKRLTHLDQTLSGSDGRFKVRAAEGDAVELRAARVDPRANERAGVVQVMRSDRSAVVRDVPAGTKDVVVRLR
jgi:hypothetical protein